MISIENKYSDQAIVAMLKSGDLSGWEHLYDNYSSIINGAILKITGDKKLAQKILIESFINLQQSDIIKQTKKPLLIFLLHHTYTFSSNYLIERGITPFNHTAANKNFPLVNLLLFTTLPHDSIAKTIGVPETELRTKLIAECHELHGKITN